MLELLMHNLLEISSHCKVRGYGKLLGEKCHKVMNLLDSSNSLIVKNHRKMIEDQATKSVEWMPWHQEPMKDAISCEKLREAANKL